MPAAPKIRAAPKRRAEETKKRAASEKLAALWLKERIQRKQIYEDSLGAFRIKEVLIKGPRF
jgi:hypothetical protein